MVDEAIVDVRLVGPPHPDQVRGDAPAERCKMGNDIAPQVRQGRVTVEKQDRLTGAIFDVVDAGAQLKAFHASLEAVGELEKQREIIYKNKRPP